MLICSKRETCRCGAAPEGLMAAIPPGLSVTSMYTPSLGRQRACIRTFAWNKAFVNYTGALLFWQADTGYNSHLERRPPVSGRACSPACHPERSEGSRSPDAEILRCAQDDRPSLQMSRHYLFIKEYSHASSADSYPFYFSASPMP